MSTAHQGRHSLENTKLRVRGMASIEAAGRTDTRLLIEDQCEAALRVHDTTAR